MRERETQNYRPFLVCSDRTQEVRSMTREEMIAKTSTGTVNWISTANGKIIGEELIFLRNYLQMMKPEEGIIPSNQALAGKMDISRRQIKRLRKTVAKKLEFKSGW